MAIQQQGDYGCSGQASSRKSCSGKDRQSWPEMGQGPPRLGFDANLIKRVRITETKEFEFRVDAVNVLNHPLFEPQLRRT